MRLQYSVLAVENRRRFRKLPEIVTRRLQYYRLDNTSFTFCSVRQGNNDVNSRAKGEADRFGEGNADPNRLRLRRSPSVTAINVKIVVWWWACLYLRGVYREFRGGKVQALGAFLEKEEWRRREAERANVPFRPRGDDSKALY